MSTTEPTSGGEPLVRDIMTTPVVTVAPSMTVKDLAALFRDRRIGGVPVVDEDRLIGIVTEGDLMALDADIKMPHYVELFDSFLVLGEKRFKEQLEKASAATVEQLMTEDVKTVAPDDPARAAATLMHKHRFDRVPVLEGEAVVGIVTRHDIMKILGL